MYKVLIMGISFACILTTSCVSKSKFASLEQQHQLLLQKMDKASEHLYEIQEQNAQLSMMRRQLVDELNNTKAKLSFTESKIDRTDLKNQEEITPNLNLSAKSESLLESKAISSLSTFDPDKSR